MATKTLILFALALFLSGNNYACENEDAQIQLADILLGDREFSQFACFEDTLCSARNILPMLRFTSIEISGQSSKVCLVEPSFNVK